jgi:hypothetical protein
MPLTVVGQNRSDLTGVTVYGTSYGNIALADRPQPSSPRNSGFGQMPSCLAKSFTPSLTTSEQRCTGTCAGCSGIGPI